MSFDWKDYIDLAEDLLSNKKESYLRSSISRAYYGVFCLARNKKNYQKYRTQKGENIHWMVINAYRKSNDPLEQRIGINLDNLRRTRNDADYKGEKTINRKNAERVIMKAKQILILMGIT